MGGLIFGALGGLMIALSFSKFENHQFRWAIKLLFFGIGIGIISSLSNSLGEGIAKSLIFAIIFGGIGGAIDFVKIYNNKEMQNKTTNHEQPAKSQNYSADRKVNETVAKYTAMPNIEYLKNNIKNEDGFWAMALEEFESTSRIKGLYAKLYAQHDGNEQQIKSQYIKERFKQLKEHQDKKIKKDDLEKENNEYEKEVKSDLESLEYNYKKITSIKLVGDKEFYKFQDGRVAIKANKTEYVLYTDFKSAENALNYSNLYGSIGFIRLITINNGKVVISCPKCKIHTRVPANKKLEIICPSCRFEWREKT